MHRILKALAWLGERELPLLLSLFVVFAGIWGFVELADEVMEQETVTMDEAVLLAFRKADEPNEPLGAAWVEEMARDVTALGSTGVLVLVSLIALGYLLLHARYRAALFTLCAVAGGTVISTVLKIGFDRTRPDLVPPAAAVYTASFPSGHAMLSAVTYLTLAALVARVHPRALVKAYLLIVAALITVLVGLSRVYLGVHWPTDVLAGWMVGAAWAALVWLLARWLQRRALVDQPR